LQKLYIVTLTPEERDSLGRFVSVGKGAARRLAHARVLLKVDAGEGGPSLGDEAAAEAVEVSIPTVARVRQRFVEEGLDAALNPRPAQREYRPKLDGEAEAHLIALACSEPPVGQAHWSLRLLAEKMVELEYIESISHETVRQTLKKTNSSPG